MSWRLLRVTGFAATAVALLVGLSLSSPYGQLGPRPVRAQVVAQAQTATTGIQIQNISQSQANIVVTFYPQDGGQSTSFTPSGSPLGAGQSLNIYNPSQIADGFKGSVIVESDQAIAAIARTDWSTDKAAAAYTGADSGATRYSLPLVVRKFYGGQNSRFTVQNVDPSADATVVVKVYRTGSATPTLTTTARAIKPGYSYTYDQENDAEMAPLGDKFIGSAVVESTTGQAIVAVADVRLQGTTGAAVYEYSGFSSGSTTLLAPMVRRNWFGYTTGLQIQNVSESQTANVRITYKGFTKSAPNTTLTLTDDFTLSPFESKNRYNGNTDTASGTVLPDNFIGSASVESTNSVPIVGIVNDALIVAGQASSASYNMEPKPATGTSKNLVIPLIRNVFPATADKLITGLQVMNIGTGSAQVSVKYVPTPGRPALTGSDTETATIGAEASKTFFSGNSDPTAGLVLPANFVGSAVVTSDSQDIIAILNDASFARTMDAAIFNALRAQ